MNIKKGATKTLATLALVGCLTQLFSSCSSSKQCAAYPAQKKAKTELKCPRW